MNILEPLNSGDIETARTQALRDAFLMERVFLPGQVTAHYIPVDRHIIGGIQPTAEALHFLSEMSDHIRTGSLLERREIGVVNLGGPGQVSHDDQVTCLARLEALYLGCGTKNVRFSSVDPSDPAKFYYHCLPAHHRYPAVHVTEQNAIKRVVFETPDGGRRIATQLITPETVETCQLSLGLLHLEGGERWVTTPPHVHPSRSEVYFYFDLEPEEVVFHFLGRPRKTRSIVVKHEQAVFAPGDLVHFGAGTATFASIWSMGGENRRIYDDMTDISLVELR